MTCFIADKDFDASVFAGSSCAFGVFDGLHTGHRFLLNCAEKTKDTGCSLAITFDKDPDEVFHPDRLKKLLSNEARVQGLQRTGVDHVVVLPFTQGLFTKSPLEFLTTTFSEGAPAHLHVGEDFRFGAKAAGTVETLREWAAESGTVIHAHKLVSADGTPITATRIRLLLLDGKVQQAQQLLGYRYGLSGIVQRGRGDGARFGFATANLQVPPLQRVLGDGVYAAYALVHDKRYRAAVSVGVPPTFEDESQANVEAHILDFEGDLHGAELRLEFVEYLRPMIKFNSTDELIATVMGNIEWVRTNLPL